MKNERLFTETDASDEQCDQETGLITRIGEVIRNHPAATLATTGLAALALTGYKAAAADAFWDRGIPQNNAPPGQGKDFTPGFDDSQEIDCDTRTGTRGVEGLSAKYKKGSRTKLRITAGVTDYGCDTDAMPDDQELALDYGDQEYYVNRLTYDKRTKKWKQGPKTHLIENAIDVLGIDTTITTPKCKSGTAYMGQVTLKWLPYDGTGGGSRAYKSKKHIC